MKERTNISPTKVANAMPPIAPSIVFLGLIIESLFLPKIGCNPKKLIFMLHGYGDNAANFMNLAHPIDQEEWQAAYIALNAPGVISGNYMGYQWFDLYPNGVYIADAGPKEFDQINKEVNVENIRGNIDTRIKKLEEKILQLLLV